MPFIYCPKCKDRYSIESIGQETYLCADCHTTMKVSEMNLRMRKCAVCHTITGSQRCENEVCLYKLANLRQFSAQRQQEECIEI